jgi:hypothetical protein
MAYRALLDLGAMGPSFWRYVDQRYKATEPGLLVCHHFGSKPDTCRQATGGQRASVEGIWDSLQGRAQLWRKHGNDEETVDRRPGTCATIPPGAHSNFAILVGIPYPSSSRPHLVGQAHKWLSGSRITGRAANQIRLRHRLSAYLSRSRYNRRERGRVSLPGRADSRIRTDDLIITNDLLYQLSYIGVLRMAPYLAVAATLRFQNAMAKRFFRILNLPIHST